MRRLQTNGLPADQKKSLYPDDITDHYKDSLVQKRYPQKSRDRLPDCYSSVDMISSAEGCSKRPIAGLIFMCNDVVRKNYFRYGVFGMPVGKKPLVDQVRPGTKLFLFEFEARELWGIYEATTAAVLDIEPDAYCGSEVAFPVQVKFRVYRKCEPLPEKKFQQAIRDNYFAKGKFNFDLTGDQVLKLMRMFSPRAIISKGVRDRGLTPLSAEPNNSHYNGKLQAVEVLDGFLDARGERWKERMMESSADSKYIQLIKREDLKRVPAEFWALKEEQRFADNPQTDLEGHLRVSHIGAANRLCPDVRIKHCLSEANFENFDLNAVGDEIVLEDVSRGDRLVLDPRYKGKQPYAGGFIVQSKRKGLMSSLRDESVRHVDSYDPMQDPKSTQSYSEEEYRLYKLKMKHLNDRAFQRELLHVDQYDRGENSLYTSLPGENKMEGEVVEFVTGLPSRQTLDYDNSQTAAARKGPLVGDEDEYLYGQGRLYHKQQLYEMDAFPQDISQTLVDRFNIYNESANNVVRKRLGDLEEDLKPCTIEKVAFVPRPPVLLHPGVVSANAIGNFDRRMHNVTQTHAYSSQSLEGDCLDPVSIRYLSTLKNSIVATKNDVTWLPNLRNEGYSILQGKDEAEEDNSYHTCGQFSPDRINNQLQGSLMRASGKRPRIVRVGNPKIVEYSRLRENASAHSAEENVKQRPSVWLRLSGPKSVADKDLFLQNKDFCKPVDLKSHSGKKKRLLPTRCGCEFETKVADLEDSSGIYEEEVIIDFKRRKGSFRHTDPLVNRDHGTVICETNQHSQMASKGNSSPADDYDCMKGRRRIKRPMLADDTDAADN